MRGTHGDANRAENFVPQFAGIYCKQTVRIKEVSPLSYDALFPQAVNLFGVIAKLAQPHVRVLGKGRRGSLR